MLFQKTITLERQTISCVILIVTCRFFLQKFQPLYDSLVPPGSTISLINSLVFIYNQFVPQTEKLSILFQCCKQAEYINEYEQHNTQTQIQQIIRKLSTFYQLLTKGIQNVHLVCYAHYDANCHRVGFFSSNFYSFYTATQLPARFSLSSIDPFVFIQKLSVFPHEEVSPTLSHVTRQAEHTSRKDTTCTNTQVITRTNPNISLTQKDIHKSVCVCVMHNGFAKNNYNFICDRQDQILSNDSSW